MAHPFKKAMMCLTPPMLQGRTLQFGILKVKQTFCGCQSSHICYECSFNGAAAFTGTGLGNWDVGKVTRMWRLFESASVFNENISSWNTSSATGLGAMVGFASYLIVR